MPIQSIAFMITMWEEALPLLQMLKLEGKDVPLTPGLPMQKYSTTVNGMQVHIVLNGVDPRYKGIQIPGQPPHFVDNVATQAGAVAALQTIQQLQPDLIVNAGTAGLYVTPKPGNPDVGAVYLGKGNICYYDRQMFVPDTGYHEYGLGNYPCLDAANLAAAIGVKRAGLASANAMAMNANGRKTLQEIGATVLDMEVAAIAWIAWLLKTPLISLKGITNYVDPNPDDPQPAATPGTPEISFIQNLENVAKNLRDKCMATLDFCAGKSIGDL